MRYNRRRYMEMRNPIFKIVAGLGGPLVMLVQKVFPKIGNRFGFFIAKPQDESELHPWIQRKDPGFDLRDDWVKERYKI